MKLLLVEDEYYTRQGILDTTPWVSLGISEVLCAGSGREGQRMLAQKPDILLTDIRLPHVSGLELAEQLRREDPFCQIIIMSSYSDKEYLMQAIRLSTVAYLEKPIRLPELSAVVRKAVMRRKDSLLLASLREKEAVTERFASLPDPDDPAYSHATRLVLTRIAESYADPTLSVESLASDVHLSTVYLGATFKNDTGLNIRPVINDVRMEAACRLLRETNLSIADVAARTGFSSANYFSKQFRKHMKTSPNDYRYAQTQGREGDDAP